MAKKVVKKSPVVGNAARKGATSRAVIPPAVKRDLDTGLIESASLSEWLAVDAGALVESCAPAIGLRGRERDLRAFAESVRHQGIMTRLREMAAFVFNAGASVEAMLAHPSDTVRSWGAYAAVMPPGLSLRQRLERLRSSAMDPNFGVREVAWFAFRPYLAANLDQGLRLLATWSLEDDENLRRFASECSRPRGVWVPHIPALKADPSPGLAVLEPLRADPSRYVQNSVANWLNDASKSTSDWTRAVCARWGRESPTDATKYIIRRGLRTLTKAEDRSRAG